MKKDTHAVGNLVVAKVLTKLLETGKRVLVPFGDGCFYDILIDDNHKFLRIQCKSAVIRRNSIVFGTVRATKDEFKNRGYRDLVEMFGVWCAENDCVYLIPVLAIPIGRGRLALDGHKKSGSSIPLAKDFLLKKI